MQVMDLKELNEHFNDEIFRHRHLDTVDEILTEDFVEHTPAPGQGTDRRATKEFLGQMLQAFPDLDFTIESQIAEGDMVSSVGRMTGTHEADFMGVAATGRHISVQVMDTARARDGRFSEHWGLVDVPALMTQLGVAPPPE
jgi:predicted ester cyclase